MRPDELRETIERLETLESKVAFQDRTIDALNEVVIRQQDQVDRLTRELVLLRKSLDSLGEASVEGGQEPPPPHY